MSGGFGGGSWGGGAFGGSSDPTSSSIPAETITFAETLTVTLPFRVLWAVALNSFLVEVMFSQPTDSIYAPNFATTNYTPSPSLVFTGAQGVGPNAIHLTTEEQADVTYQLTVADGRSSAGDILQPPNQIVSFAGFPVAPKFFATAQAKRKIVLIFSATMNMSAPAFTVPSNYTLTDLQGNAMSVLSVTPDGGHNQATLALGADLTPGVYYSIELSATIQTAAGLSLVPRTDLFQWVPMVGAITTGPITIPFSSFSGEVTTGLLGQPAGQLFFSPALNTSVPNSVIRVSDASLCTRAFDAYEFPQPVDPPPLFTFSPLAPPAVLGPTSVLWSSAERMGIARITLSNTHMETMPATTDGPADATLVEPIDITKASFLNDSRWKLFPGTANFKTASNLSPIGPGPTTHINLEP